MGILMKKNKVYIIVSDDGAILGVYDDEKYAEATLTSMLIEKGGLDYKRLYAYYWVEEYEVERHPVNTLLEDD